MFITSMSIKQMLYMRVQMLDVKKQMFGMREANVCAFQVRVGGDKSMSYVTKKTQIHTHTHTICAH